MSSTGKTGDRQIDLVWHFARHLRDLPEVVLDPVDHAQVEAVLCHFWLSPSIQTAVCLLAHCGAEW